jgi:signal transduction histidine kinase
MDADDPKLTVHVLAKLPRDAELTCEHLHQVGIRAQCTSSFDDLLQMVDQDIGALMITEDAVPTHRWNDLADRLSKQPAWADIPVIVCARKQQSSVDRVLLGAGSVTMIETPVRVNTVISAARAALRARKRQYEMRELLTRLEDADRRKDEFLAMLGHELRNPLAAIQLAVQLKQMRAPNEEAGSSTICSTSRASRSARFASTSATSICARSPGAVYKRWLPRHAPRTSI